MMSPMSRFTTVVFLLALFLAMVLTGCSHKRVPYATLREQAHFAFWVGNWPQAQAGYAELTERSADNWTFQYKLGTAALHNDDLDTARQALAIAETLRPQDRTIAVNLAETMYRQNDQDALFTFLVDRAESTQAADDWLLLATYSLDLEDPDMARLAVQQALMLDNSESAQPYVVAAKLSQRLGDIDAALRSLKIAWTLEPDNSEVHAMIRGLGEVPGPTMLDRTEMGG
jgi:Flp pilus assembly protein TadD